MDQWYIELNRIQSKQLRALSQRTDAELAQTIGAHWTVGVALAHLAYWDGRVFAAIEAWRRHDIALALHTDDEAYSINDLRLPIWQAVPPRGAGPGGTPPPPSGRDQRRIHCQRHSEPTRGAPAD
jgi:hypothetical protein